MAIFELNPKDERTQINQFYAQYIDDFIHLIYVYEMANNRDGYKYYFYSDHTETDGYYQRYEQTEHDLAAPLYRQVVHVNELENDKQEQVIQKVFSGIRE